MSELYFKQDGLIISCIPRKDGGHVPDDWPPYNAPGYAFNMGGASFFPCDRCLTAIRDAINFSVLSEGIASALQNGPELRNEAIKFLRGKR